MTPIERLQAAIDKLEAQRDACRWDDIAPLDYTDGHVWGIEAVADPSDPTGQTAMPSQVLLAETSADGARLIVTLHRTIDAQLAILRFAVDGLYDLPEFLMLADAILGSDS